MRISVPQLLPVGASLLANLLPPFASKLAPTTSRSIAAPYQETAV